MQKLALTITDRATGALAPVQSATVAVYDAGTSTLAALYQDDDATTKTNPLTSDANGFVDCKLPNGAYDVAIAYGDVVQRINGFYAYDGSASAITISMPGQFSVDGGVNVTWTSQTAKTFLAGPTSGSAAAPVFRAITAGDIGTGSPSSTTWLRGDGAWQSLPVSSFMVVEDQKTAGTAGGTFTSGAWQTRDLNTTVLNGITGASIASNQITLPAGTYRLSGIAPAYAVNGHQTRLQNVTDGVTLMLGTTAYVGSGNGTVTNSTLDGVFTLSASRTIELQHRCQVTSSTNGLGFPKTFNGNPEVYSRLVIEKMP